VGKHSKPRKPHPNLRPRWLDAAALSLVSLVVAMMTIADRSPAALDSGVLAATVEPTTFSIIVPAAVSPATTLASAATTTVPRTERPRFTGSLRVTVIGDSLALSAATQIAAALIEHEITIDAVEGRTLAQAQSGALAAIGHESTPPDVVVVALGTNDWATTPAQVTIHVAELLSILSATPCVVWIDAQEFRTGLVEVNAVIHEAMTDRDGGVGYWSNIAGPASLHSEDGYHLSGDGFEVFAGLIGASVDVLC
jgi:hypothetical protein